MAVHGCICGICGIWLYMGVYVSIWGVWRYMSVYEGIWSETMFLVNPTMDRDSVSWHWLSWGEDAAVTAWSETMSLALFVDIPMIR